MNPPWKTFAGPVLVVVVLIAVIYLWHIGHRPNLPIQEAQNIGNFDEFQQSLRNRVLSQLGVSETDSDFTAVVATTAFPVGTLLDAERSVPANYTDCLPNPGPTAFDAAHLFPSYEVSSDTALTANLGSNVIQGMESAGINLKQSSKVVYRIDDTQILIMDSQSVEKIIGLGNCGKYISTHPGVRLIRGFVTGKMTFMVKLDNPASVAARLNRIGEFSVSDDPQSSMLSISDKSSQPIVELLSTFRPVSIDSNKPTPSALGKAEPTRSLAPVGETVQAHMFIQQDVTDSSDAGPRMVDLLHAGWPKAKVESTIDKLPTEKMPDTTQVRFFNASDAELANRCLIIVQQRYPNARVVRIGLPAPAGQLEVWLPKVKAA
jgi:hypothetical protein